MDHKRSFSHALVVGCGGLGSETIKLLNTMEIPMTVLDYDVVETSNLNRQFFFRDEDVGKYKADVISSKIGTKGLVKRVEDLQPADLNEFDVVFLCLDTVSTRMHMNYIFWKSKCKILIDCGVQGFKAHAKRVTRGEPCLYCIKDLYTVDNDDPHLCSLKSMNQEITSSNRDLILRSMIFQIKEGSPGKIAKGNIYQGITEKFNKGASPLLHTTPFEVEGIFNRIIPNVCTINAICASLGIILAFHMKEEDFIYFDGENGVFFNNLRLEKDERCFVCSRVS